MSLTDDDLIKIMDLLVEQINKNLETKQIKIRLQHRCREVHPREDLRGSQLRRASVAPGAAEVHRRSAVGSADPGASAEAGGTGYLSGRHGHLLSAGESAAPLPVAVAAGEAEIEAEPVQSPGIPLYTF